MATKKKASAKAPASKKPVAKLSAAEAAEIGRQERIAKRAAKTAENKARHAANHAVGRQASDEIIATTKAAGKRAAADVKPVPLILLTPRIGRPPLPQFGPPVQWSSVLGDALFILIATGHSMDEISKMENMPPLYQMLQWFADKEHPFFEIRTRAKEQLIPLYEEMAQSIALRTNSVVLRTRRQVVTRDGDVVWTTEKREVDGVERSKLALEGLRWTLSHLQPKKHGRNPDQSTGTANEQLKGLFDALKAGPVKS